jgi:enoyl-CoA hydratase/carnithine racemase
VSLEEFNSWGVINQIVDPPEDLSNAVKSYAKELSRKSLEILTLTKNAINTMSTRLANEFYNLETNYAEYYFAGLKGESRIGLDEFLKKMTEKYTKLK